jgi:hypothetical protein
VKSPRILVNWTFIWPVSNTDESSVFLVSWLDEQPLNYEEGFLDMFMNCFHICNKNIVIYFKYICILSPRKCLKCMCGPLFWIYISQF